MKQNGFTFIEVLISMLIFVLAAVTAIDLVRGAVRGTARTREVTVATWLLQNLMTQLETNIDTLGFDEGCTKKTEAKFPAPYQNFKWTAYCEEIDIRLSETAAQAMNATQGEEDSSEDSSLGGQFSENQVIKMIFNIASEYITSSLREITGEVSWVEGTQNRSISASTHVVRFDQQLPPLTSSGISN